MFKDKSKKQTETSNLSLSFKSYTLADVNESLSLSCEFVSRLNRFLNWRQKNQKLNSNSHLSPCGPAGESLNLTQPSGKIVRSLNTWKSISASRKNQISKRILTVTRSPFVFKKTREQFAFLNHNKLLNLNLSKPACELTLTHLAQLRLPSELKIKFKLSR